MSIGRREFFKTGCAAALGILSTRALLAQSHRAQQYNGQLLELGALEEGDTLAYVINDNKHVVGTSGKRGFVWTFETGIQDLGDLGGGTTNGYNINHHNVIVGDSTTSNGDTHAFVYQNGSMYDLGTLGGDYSSAEEVNVAGIVVGASKGATGIQHAYTGSLERGLTPIPSLGGQNAYAVSINSSGQVCGGSETTNGEEHAFIYDAARGIVDIGTLGGGYSEGWQINDAGVACGISTNAKGETHGFVWIPDEVNGIEGTMLDIGGFNGLGTYANYVSDDGIILAMTEDENIPLIANIDANELSISPLYNPYYELEALEYARDGYQNEMRIQAPCAINSTGDITGWGVRDGARRAYVLTSVTS